MFSSIAYKAKPPSTKLDGKPSIRTRVIIPNDTGRTHLYCMANGNSLTRKWMKTGLDTLTVLDILRNYNKYILFLCLLYKKYNIRLLGFNQLLLNYLGLEENVIFRPPTINFEYSSLDSIYLPFQQILPEDKSIYIDSINIHVVDEQLIIYIYKNWFLQYKWALSVDKSHPECYFLRQFLNITNGKTIIKNYRKILKNIRSTIENEIELTEDQKVNLKELIYRNNCLTLIFFLCKKIIGEVIDDLTIAKYKRIMCS